MKSKYINIDFEIRSKHDLNDLVREIGDKLFLLHKGNLDNLHFVSFEAVKSTELNETIAEIHNIVNSLSKESKEIFLKAESLIFDIGFETFDAKETFSSLISLDVLRMIVGLNATINITIYANNESL